MKTILFIADPESVHDLKWISFFSQNSAKIRCVLQPVSNLPYSSELKNNLKGMNITMLPQLGHLSLKKPITSFRSWVKFKKVLSDTCPDIVHFLFVTPNALYAPLVKGDYILTTRGSDILVLIPGLKSGKGLRGLYYKVLFWIYARIFKRARFVTGTSSKQLATVEQLFSVDASRLHLIRTGIEFDKINQLNIEKYLPRSLKGNEVIFSPRFMSPIYDICLQIDAIDYLPDEILKRYLFVYVRGKKFDRDYFHNVLNRLELLKQKRGLCYIVFDYLDQQSLWSVLHMSSLCVMTPLSDGTPNSALETMASKCPLILPNLNYDRDIFDSACMVLKERNPESLADIIVSALEKYPIEFLETAYDRVIQLGNRKIEMNKLGQLYNEM